jgi:hypothetical protein
MDHSRIQFETNHPIILWNRRRGLRHLNCCDDEKVLEKHLTPDEFLLLPDSIAFELVDGQLVERDASALSRWVATSMRRLSNTSTLIRTGVVSGPNRKNRPGSQPRWLDQQAARGRRHFS